MSAPEDVPDVTVSLHSDKHDDPPKLTGEMELAATVAVAAHHGLGAGGLFDVSDRFVDEWTPGFEDAFENLETAVDYGIDVLRAA